MHGKVWGLERRGVLNVSFIHPLSGANNSTFVNRVFEVFLFLINCVELFVLALVGQVTFVLGDRNSNLVIFVIDGNGMQFPHL